MVVLASILFYFFDYHIKTFILHITFFRDLLWLYFLTACLCSTFVIVLHVFLILQYYYMLLFSCVPLFSPANSEKTIVPTKITNTGILYGSDSTPGLMLTVFFTFFLSTFLRFYAFYISTVFFNYIIEYPFCIFIKVILFYPSINNSIYFSSYIHFNPSITNCISHWLIYVYTTIVFLFLYLSWFLPSPLLTTTHYFSWLSLDQLAFVQ